MKFSTKDFLRQTIRRIELHLVGAASIVAVLSCALCSEAAANPGPSPQKTLAIDPGGDAVLLALENAEYRFTPEVKTAYLAWSRARALEKIQAAGHKLPDDFLAWVDGDPIVATTIFGSADAPQRLALLRSLELDLGPEVVREKYTQWIVAVAVMQANLADPATLSNPDQGISLESRGLMKLEIKRFPMEKVDTRAKDRQLDLEDHIINFLEDHPVTEEVQVTKEVDGEKVQAAEQRTRPLYAYEVMSNPQHQIAFNEYMKAHGQNVTLDCGDLIHPRAPKSRNVAIAYFMFRKAYLDKGRIPQQIDPWATPAEIAAYVIRNDQFRFPEGSGRSWPWFRLDAPWPVLQYLASDRMSLRDREFIWRRFVDTGVVTTYGKYIGKIAHSPGFVEARNLQPFDYASGTYPVMLRDGGMCGVTSNIGRRAHIAMGVPAVQATQPGHSCYVAAVGDVEYGFSLKIGQSAVSGRRTAIPGYASYRHELCRMSAVNFGLIEMLDAKMAYELLPQLPAATTVVQQIGLLRSGWERNPYYWPLFVELQGKISDPAAQVQFYFDLEKTLAGVNKSNCSNGPVIELAREGLESRLPTLLLPTDKAKIDLVRSYLVNHSNDIWLKYELAGIGLPALQRRMAEELKASVTGTRTPAACAKLAERLTRVGAAIEDPEHRAAWANELLPTVAGKAEYPGRSGRRNVTLTDPCEQVLLNMVPATAQTRAEAAQ